VEDFQLEEVEEHWIGSEVYSHESEESKKKSIIKQVLANMMKHKIEY